MEELINEFKTIVGAYYGVQAMDNYPLKEFVLKDIKNYIIDYLNNNLIVGDLKILAAEYEKNSSLKRKLQDSMIILNKMDSSRELISMIKIKLKEL